MHATELIISSLGQTPSLNSRLISFPLTSVIFPLSVGTAANSPSLSIAPIIPRSSVTYPGFSFLNNFRCLRIYQDTSSLAWRWSCSTCSSSYSGVACSFWVLVVIACVPYFTTAHGESSEKSTKSRIRSLESSVSGRQHLERKLLERVTFLFQQEAKPNALFHIPST